MLGPANTELFLSQNPALHQGQPLSLDTVEPSTSSGHSPGGTTARSARSRGGRPSQRRWLADLAAVTVLAALTTAGCGSAAPGPHHSQGTARPPGTGEGGSSGGQAAGPPLTPGLKGPAALNGAGVRSGITGGALFGGNTSLASVAGKLGQRLAIVRVYYRLGQSFPRQMDQQLMATGSTLLVSLDTVPGGPTYASIAAGREDATISAFLRAVNQAAVRYRLAAIYFSFEHEPNVLPHHYGLGTPAEFIQAWDHVHQLAESARLDWNQSGRIHWVLILTHGAFSPSRPPAESAAAYWPGTNEVDVVAADGYDNYGCVGQTPGRTPESLFSPALNFARANGGLPVFIAEWGSTAFPSVQRQTSFIQQMQAFVASNPAIQATMYWNNRGIGPHCDFSINPYPSSIAALAATARSAAMQGHLTS
jgi:hypothetical protein